MRDLILGYAIKYGPLVATLAFVVLLAYLAETGKALPDPPYHNHSHSPQQQRQEESR